MSPSNTDLGAAIRRLRRERGLTIEGLGFRADWHPTYVSQVERGIKSPSWGKLVALAAALDVSMVELAQHADDEAVVARAASVARLRLRERRSHVVLVEQRHDLP
ncbi:MAG TPA: helix-turn-helix transcriptional regulator [Solirubrobacteraceae bacterium]|nr:helix-turn-helix transcriptional regulator [Solirubrobacteraceae bacterium]